MRRLRLGVVLLAAAWLVVEMASVPFAEGQIERRVAERNREAAEVETDIDSFPFLSRLVATGRVRQVTITLDRVVRMGVTFTDVRFDLEGIEVDRAAALRQDTRITAIERGTATAAIELGELGGAVRGALDLAGGQVSVRGNRLFLGPASVPIPSQVLPCDPEARFDGGRVVVSCTIHDVPQVLLAGAQR